MTSTLRSLPVSAPSRAIRSLARGAAVVALTLAAVSAVGFVTGDDDRTVQAVGEALGAGGEYHALPPQRVLDTRDPALDYAPLGRKPIHANESGAVFNVPIVGKGGLPAWNDGPDADLDDDDVLAVAVNITVVTPTHEGWLRAFGAGAPEGTSSIVNFKPGQVVPNNAILRPGANGELSIRLVGTGAGSADVLIDVFGWWSSSNYETNGARLIPVGPGRVYDSREAQFGATPIAGGQTVPIKIRGASSFSPAISPIVPDSANVVGVMINLTGVNVHSASQATHFSVLPASPASPPTTSNLNLARGDVRANASIVPVVDGNIYVHNFAGRSDIIVDVVAYLVNGQDPLTKQGRVVPLVSPFRAFDTREQSHRGMPLGPARAEDWSFKSFVADVKVGTEPLGAQLGLLGNLTATGLTRQYEWAPAATHLTAFPTPASGNDIPTVSNVNVTEGFNVPNLALLKYGAGDGPHVRFYNRGGYLHYLLDVSAVILSD